MSAEQARAGVQFADRARERARQDAGPAWLAVALYAAFAVTAVAIPAGTNQGKFLWVMAAPVVVVGTGLWAYADGRHRGIESSLLGLIAIPFGLLTLALGVGTLAWFIERPTLAQLGPPVLMAAGYVAVGSLQRRRVMIAVGAAVPVVATGLFLLGARDEMAYAVLAFGCVVVLLAAHLRWRLMKTRTS